MKTEQQIKEMTEELYPFIGPCIFSPLNTNIARQRDAFVKGFKALQDSINYDQIDLDKIVGIIYKLSDSGEDDAWLESEKFYDVAKELLMYLQPKQTQESEVTKQDEFFKLIRRVISEATSVYCHYNNIVSEKEFVNMKNLIELNNLVSIIQFKNRNK